MDLLCKCRAGEEQESEVKHIMCTILGINQRSANQDQQEIRIKW